MDALLALAYGVVTFGAGFIAGRAYERQHPA